MALERLQVVSAVRLIGPARFACAVVFLALSTGAGCESAPEFAVPPGPARSVAVDVELPIYVMSRWAVGGFVDALRIELAKYRVDVVAPGTPGASSSVEIELGQFTYRQWQSVDVRSVLADGKLQPVGSVRLPDLHDSTIEGAALPVAVIVARYVWGAPPAATRPGE